MSYGLKIWDASGNVTLDTSHGLCTILGQVSRALSGTVYSGTVTNSDFSRGTPFYIITQMPISDWSGWPMATTVSFSGNTMTWNVPMSSGAGYNDQGGSLNMWYGYF